jgi:hypothetical protein
MIDSRRTFMGALAGFFCISTATAAQPKKALKGFMVFTVNVGGLPALQAEAFADRLRNKLEKQRKDDAWQIVMLLVRPPEKTKFEVIVIGDEAEGKIAARQLRAFEMLEESKKYEFPSLEEVKDYVLLRLGEPAQRVELKQEQIDSCYNEVVKELTTYGNGMHSPEDFKDGALAYAKIILGKIRRQRRDGWFLYREGNRELRAWRKRIRA